MVEIQQQVKDAAVLVAADMSRRPVTASDGIWRFDNLLRDFFGELSRETWREISQVACIQNAARDTWNSSGYGIVWSYAEKQLAFKTPGFFDALRSARNYDS